MDNHDNMVQCSGQHSKCSFCFHQKPHHHTHDCLVTCPTGIRLGISNRCAPISAVEIKPQNLQQIICGSAKNCPKKSDCTHAMPHVGEECKTAGCFMAGNAVCVSIRRQAEKIEKPPVICRADCNKSECPHKFPHPSSKICQQACDEATGGTKSRCEPFDPHKWHTNALRDLDYLHGILDGLDKQVSHTIERIHRAETEVEKTKALVELHKP